MRRLLTHHVSRLAHESLAGASPVDLRNLGRCKAYYRQLTGPTAAEVRRVRVPVLLLCGAADLLVRPEQTRALRALLSSATTELRVVPSTSHQLMQEDPAAVNALLEEFFARV